MIIASLDADLHPLPPVFPVVQVITNECTLAYWLFIYYSSFLFLCVYVDLCVFVFNVSPIPQSTSCLLQIRRKNCLLLLTPVNEWLVR